MLIKLKFPFWQVLSQCPEPLLELRTVPNQSLHCHYRPFLENNSEF